MGPALGDNTLAQDDDDVALLNSGEAMGDNDGGALAGVRGNHRVYTLLKKCQVRCLETFGHPLYRPCCCRVLNE